jgi:peptidoglycan/xylan/chitin deacetylase (PgdA/CDA1 family)
VRQVLLSFDIEEFDMPLEYDILIPFDEQIKISQQGTETILDILLEHNISATFFSTVVFATHSNHLIERIVKEGHELASHGFYHSAFKKEDLLTSRLALEKISGKQITGYRMARMMPVEDMEIEKAGYAYNSSLNPVYLPGRYNNLSKPRTLFKINNLIQVPASATPILRLPLFWLSFHNFPLWFYKDACRRTINKDQYLNLYFHPWEFTELKKSHPQLPKFVIRNSGHAMTTRFNDLILWMKKQGYTFNTINRFLEN